jgi:hypothetical protein
MNEVEISVLADRDTYDNPNRRVRSFEFPMDQTSF